MYTNFPDPLQLESINAISCSETLEENYLNSSENDLVKEINLKDFESIVPELVEGNIQKEESKDHECPKIIVVNDCKSKLHLMSEVHTKSSVIGESGAVLSKPLIISSLSDEVKHNYKLEKEKNVYPNLQNIQDYERMDDIVCLKTLVTTYSEEYLNKTVNEANCKFKEFLKDLSGTDEHPLYGLVYSYQQSRKSSIDIHSQMKYLTSLLKRKTDYIWNTVSKEVTGKGICGDGNAVTVSHSFSFKELNDEIFNEVLEKLNNLQESILSMAFYSYTELLMKMRIEQYLFNVIKNFDTANSTSVENSIVSRCSELNLKKCISVLFSFQRMPTIDKHFLEETHKWLQIMVSALLQNGNISDYIFILNHVLRCPYGIRFWASKFIQIPWSSSCTKPMKDKFNCYCLYHLILVLYMILHPVPEREQFLKHVKGMLPVSLKDEKFTVLDSEGEEENAFEVIKDWSDEDLTSLLNQISIAKICEHCLMEYNEMELTVKNPSEDGLIRLFAFSTALSNVLFSGLRHMDSTRYQVSVELISTMIRDMVCYVSNHWGYCRGLDYMRPILQAEFDRFVFHAVYSIFHLQKLGVLKFLPLLPYEHVSPRMLWQFLWIFHCHSTDEDTVYQEKDVDRKLLDGHIDSIFLNNLKNFSQNDQLYLLIAYESMVASGNVEESFLSFIIAEIYEVAFMESSLCHLIKECKIIFSHIIKKYPIVLTTLLQEISKKEETVINISVQIFEDISLDNWFPRSNDVQLISEWLLSNELSNPKNHIARLVLSKMNWDFSTQGDLFLPIGLHREIAVYILQAYVKFDTNGNKWSVSRGLTQMFQFTTLRSFSKENEGFVPWAWDLLFTLKLHNLDRKSPCWFQIYDGFLQVDDLPNLTDDLWLQPLQQALETNHPAACYLSLVMTNIGHGTETLLSRGLLFFECLVNNEQFMAAIHSLYYILPFFVKRTDELLLHTEFMSAMVNLVVADVSYLSTFTDEAVIGAVLHKIAAMIKHQIFHSWNLTVECAVPLLKLWLKLLLKVLATPIPKKCSIEKFAAQIYFLLDVVLKISFMDAYTRDTAIDLLFHFGNPLLKASATVQTSFWTKYFAKNYEFYTILKKEIFPNYPWLAFAILLTEINQKPMQDLWNSVQKEVYRDENITPSAALMKAATFCKLSPPPLNSLPIYRWALQIAETPISHPVLPLIWQQFFLYYFQKMSLESQLSLSIGHHYFKQGNSKNLLAKLIKRLHETMNFYYSKLQKSKEASTIETEDSQGFAKEDENEKNKKLSELAVNFELCKLFKAFSVWMSDSKLHAPNVCFSAMDPSYCHEKLKLIFENDKAPWYDIVLWSTLKEELNQKIHPWLTKRHSFSTADKTISSETKYVRHLLKHLNVGAVKPMSCDLVIEPSTKVIEGDTLCSWDALLHLIESNQLVIFDKAKAYTDLSQRLKQLNNNYRNLVPSEYNIFESSVTIERECYKGSNSKGCSSPAKFILPITSYDHNCRIKEQIERNRIDYEIVKDQLLSLPLHQLCSASIHIENYISTLSIKMKSAKGEEAENLRKIGESLFYHELDVIDKVLPSVTSFSPSRQFFSSSIESLGREFVLGQEDQLLPLARSIVKYQNAGVLASNLLVVNIVSATVLRELYSIVLHAIENGQPYAAFVLLSKVKLQCLLKENQINFSDRKLMFQSICCALNMCGADPTEENLPVFEILKKHFSCLLLWMFPDLYGEATRFLIEGMEKQQVSVDMWYETFQCVTGIMLHSNSSINEIQNVLKKFACNILLPPDQQIFVASHPLDVPFVKEVLSFISDKFLKKRKQQNLYDSYQKYIKPFGLYLALMNHSLLRLITEKGLPLTHCTADIWNNLSQSFFPWLHPLINGSNLNFPWCDEKMEYAKYMFQIFAVTIINLHEILLGNYHSKSFLSYVWTSYVDVYVKHGIRHYSVSLCHEELINLPWNEFYLDFEDINGMCIVLQSNLNESKEFLAKLSMQIPWLDVMKTISETEHVECVRKTLATLGKLLVISGLDVSLTKSNAYQNKLKALEKLPWYLLSLEDCESLLTSYYAKYNPQHVAEDDPNSNPNFYILQFLKIICGLTDAQTDNSSDYYLSQSKHLLYVRKYILCISSSLSEKDSILSKSEKLERIMPSLLSEAEKIILKRVEPSQQMSIALPLVQEIFVFLNNISGSKFEDLAVKSVVSWVKNNKSTPLLLPCLHTACQHITQTTSAVEIAECCISTRFNFDIIESSEAQNIWNIICPFFQVHVSTKEEFIQSCINKNAFLSLYCHVLETMPKLSSSESKKLLLLSIVGWIKRADLKNIKGYEEAKCLPLWDKILELCIMLIYENEVLVIRDVLLSFCSEVLLLCEDKSSSGFLGTIGLGSSSTLSVNFRFLSRVICTFILIQIPTNTSIRLEPMAPGQILDESTKQPSGNPCPSKLAYQSLAGLRALLKKQSYSALQELVNSAIEYVIDPRNCFLDSRQLLRKYALLVFPKHSFLHSLG